MPRASYLFIQSQKYVFMVNKTKEEWNCFFDMKLWWKALQLVVFDKEEHFWCASRRTDYKSYDENLSFQRYPPSSYLLTVDKR